MKRHLLMSAKQRRRKVEFEQSRVVSNDWTVRCDNRFYQILKRNDPLPRPRRRVTVRRLLDGTIQLLYQENKLRFKEIEPPATALRYGKLATACG